MNNRQLVAEQRMCVELIGLLSNPVEVEEDD
jgi:hypothetical protein